MTKLAKMVLDLIIRGKFLTISNLKTIALLLVFEVNNYSIIHFKFKLKSKLIKLQS